MNPSAIGESCCDVINRGAFYADGKIIYNLLDGHTVAIDAESGKELWKTQFADVAAGETTPMAPFVVKDRVIVGASGGEFGIYGYVKGLDLKTGKIVWTGRNIGPDADMLAKAGTFKPFYDKGADLGKRAGPIPRTRPAARRSGARDILDQRLWTSPARAKLLARRLERRQRLFVCISIALGAPSGLAGKRLSAMVRWYARSACR